MTRIEDYALLGDLHTAALVGRDGSVDWLCVPRFDSPACFAALLDTAEAGRWLLAPATGGECQRRRYRGDTLVLETEWDTPAGSVRVVDFMPPRGEAPDIVRIVEGLSGAVPMYGELRLHLPVVVAFTSCTAAAAIAGTRAGLAATAYLGARAFVLFNAFVEDRNLACSTCTAAPTCSGWRCWF